MFTPFALGFVFNEVVVFSVAFHWMRHVRFWRSWLSPRGFLTTTRVLSQQLAHGADPTTKNQEGQTPLDLATVSALRERVRGRRVREQGGVRSVGRNRNCGGRDRLRENCASQRRNEKTLLTTNVVRVWSRLPSRLSKLQRPPSLLSGE